MGLSQGGPVICQLLRPSVKEDTPDPEVSRLKARLAKQKKEEKKKKKERKGLALMERQHSRIQRERRMKAEEEGIPLDEVESLVEDPSKEEEDTDDNKGVEDDDDEGEMVVRLGITTQPRSHADRFFVQEVDILEVP